jgi:hypothetical protein
VVHVNAPLPAVPDPGDGWGPTESWAERSADSSASSSANTDPFDVGAFDQGNPASRWALARYLVGRAVGESISRSLLVVALLVLVVAGLVEWAGSTFWAVVIAVIASCVLGLRALLAAVLRRLTAAGTYRPIEQRLRALVADTHRDVHAELRRIGLPSRSWTLPLIAVRLLRRRSRADTLARLRTFSVDHVVPRARVDELHVLLREAVGRSGGF